MRFFGYRQSRSHGDYRKVLPAPYVVVSLFGLLVAMGGIGRAASVPRSFPELVNRAEKIFVGTVSELRNEWDGAVNAPFTYVTFSDIEMAKGEASPDGTVTLRFLGGPTPEGLTLFIPESPKFVPGEKVVVFSAGNERDVIPLVGISQGLLRVKKDPDSGSEVMASESGVPLLGLVSGQFLRNHESKEGTERSFGSMARRLTLREMLRLISVELQNGSRKGH